MSTQQLLPPWPRTLWPLLLVVALGLLGHWLSQGGDSDLELSLWFGLVFGVLLQRSRFCFFCVTRDYFERRDARGLLGIIAALAIGLLGYHLVFGAFLPDPSSGRLPPGAHIGPISWVLIVGAFSFGVGMALAGSCVSAVLYRIGEGMVTAPIILLGVVVGFAIGFISWNALYLGALQQAPSIWLPEHLGYGGALGAQLLVLALLAYGLVRTHRTVAQETTKQPWWLERWPTWVGGLLIGMLATVAYLRLSPLGVTAEIGSWARTSADSLGLLPSRLEGLDALRGCATVIKESLWSANGVFILALVGGSWAAAYLGGNISIRKPSAVEGIRSFLGGILMGFGAMVALGCTVGTLLSGIMASALSGWLFALFCLAGLYIGWRVRQALER